MTVYGRRCTDKEAVIFLLGFNGVTGSNGLVKTSLGQSMEIGFWLDFGVLDTEYGPRFHAVSFGVML